MNVEFAYIWQSFLPEIILIAVALLALAVGLLAPRAGRTWLVLLAALGCLAAAVAAGVHWSASTRLAPAFVQRDIHERALLAKDKLDDLALSPAGQTISATASMPVEAITNVDARNVVTAIRTLDIKDEPGRGLGIGHPGVAAWWLFAGDQYADAFKVILALAAFLVLLLTARLPLERYRSEFAAMLLFATFGLMVMVSAHDLVVIFLGLEVASVCLYALAAWKKDDARSAEAGMKYLLLGSLASAFIIYGASLLFVKCGSTHLLMLAESAKATDPVILIGAIMMLVGFGFKVAAAPFHLWAPDVYHGAPTPVTAFLSTASKAAGFAVLLRVLAVGFPALQNRWWILVAVMAAASMVIGNLVAIHQNHVKRLLAYSGIAQAGYLLIGLVSVGLSGRPQAGTQAIILYLFLYMVGNIGAFSIAGIVAQETGDEEMTGFAGLRERAPLLAFAMTLLLLSLGGIPLLAGFVGKWYLFLSGVLADQYWLALLGAATSVVSLYYYLLIVKQIYILPAPEKALPIRSGAWAGAGVAIIVVITLAIGMYHGPFLQLAETAARSLLSP